MAKRDAYTSDPLIPAFPLGRCSRIGFPNDFQERSDLFNCSLCSDPMLLSQDRDRTMLNELIRPTNANDRRCDSRIGQAFHDGAAKPIVKNMILERADHINATGKELERAGIQWFDPSRVDQRDGNAFSFQKIGGFSAPRRTCFPVRPVPRHVRAGRLRPFRSPAVWAAVSVLHRCLRHEGTE